jgi:predicted ATP-binding protein involved in virulence
MQNFRCFEDVELGPFDPQFNLLVGENGAGKSSVLVALANLFRDIPISFGNNVQHQQKSTIETQIDYDDRRDARAFPRHDWQSPGVIDISSSYRWLDENGRNIITIKGEGSFELTGTARSPLKKSDFVKVSIPLLLLFPTTRKFHRSIPSSGGPEPSSQFERGEAFQYWTRAGESIDQLLRWVRDETLVEFENAQKRGSVLWKGDDSALGLVRRACLNAIDGAKDFFYNGTAKDIIFIYIDGRAIALSTMSDGQRALVGLVAEVARRAYVLNGTVLGQKCLEETPGLVLIDEIDLHLHPKWQRQIVPALKKIFPKIQFFATTHSPQVIGEAKPEEIIVLTPQGQRRPSGGYGRDSNWILECVMDAEGRDPEIALRLKEMFNLIEDEKFDEARLAIKALRQDIGYGPDVVGAEAYLWRMEHLGEEAAE